MKKLLLGVAAIGLSGCSWLDLGGQNASHLPTSTQYGTYNGQGSVQGSTLGNTQGQVISQPTIGTWQNQPVGQTYNQVFGQGQNTTHSTVQNHVNKWQHHRAPANYHAGGNVQNTTHSTVQNHVNKWQHHRAPANYHAGGNVQNSSTRTIANKASNGCCAGGNTLSRWNVEAGIGPEFFLGGDAISGNDINDIPGVTSDDLSFNDVYGTGFRYDLGASYALNPNRKVTANVFYANADSDEVSLGNINGEAVTGRLDDYERYGVEVGLRQYARPIAAPLVNSVRPYVEGKVGAARIRDIDFVNSNPNATALAGTTPFYDGGWVPTGAGLVGVETPVFNRFTVGVESGIRYTAGPSSDTTVLSAGVPLAGTNNGGGNWSVPLQIRGRYRF